MANKENKAAKPKEEDNKIPLKVDNKLNPKAKEQYRAYCDFTTMKLNKKTKRQESTQLKKGDIITEREVPMPWINQGLSQKFLISVSDFKKWDKKTFKKNGYN